MLKYYLHQQQQMLGTLTLKEQKSTQKYKNKSQRR